MLAIVSPMCQEIYQRYNKIRTGSCNDLVMLHLYGLFATNQQHYLEELLKSAFDNLKQHKKIVLKHYFHSKKNILYLEKIPALLKEKSYVTALNALCAYIENYADKSHSLRCLYQYIHYCFSTTYDEFENYFQVDYQ
jgi:hypothetical protein